jgi:hypothetical protein
VHLVQLGVARQVEPKLATVVLNKSPCVVLAGLLCPGTLVADDEHVILYLDLLAASFLTPGRSTLNTCA